MINFLGGWASTSAVLLLVLFYLANSVHGDEINFYDENGSFSMIRTIGYGGCYKFAPVWDKRATAVDIVEERSCFNVWKSPDCTGDHLKLTKKEGSYELKPMNFDKAIRAVSLCSWDEEGRPDPMVRVSTGRQQQGYDNRGGYQQQPQQGRGGLRGEVKGVRGGYGGSYGGGVLDNGRQPARGGYGGNYGGEPARGGYGGNYGGEPARGGYGGNYGGEPTRGGYEGNSGGGSYRRDDANIRRLPPQTSASAVAIQNPSNDIWDLAVQEQNKYRAQHGAKDIRGDPKIHEDAQRYAESLISSNNKVQATTLGNRYASYVATSFRKSKADAVKDVISRIYSKGKLQEYEVEATEMGIGAAWSQREEEWVIVVFYNIPDSYYYRNFQGQMGESGNIPQGRASRTYQ